MRLPLWILFVPVCTACGQSNAPAFVRSDTEPVRKGNEPLTAFRPTSISYVREITEKPGKEAEAKFKPELIKIKGVSRAYLVWAHYGNNLSPDPVLAIVADPASKAEILKTVTRVCQTDFPQGSGFYVDTAFPPPAEEAKIKAWPSRFLIRTEQRRPCPRVNARIPGTA